MKGTALHLEFAPGARSVSWAGRALLGVSAVLLAFELFQMGSALVARRAESAGLVEFEARRSRIAAVLVPLARPNPAYLAKVRSAQLVARSLTTPWADLLAALESAPQQAVALLSIEPSWSKQSVRLTAEAHDPQAMLDYIDALQNDSRLLSVALISHQFELQTPGAPVRFQLQAGWGPAK